MDNYQITVNTFDKLAQRYQDKYMDMTFYHDTYDTLCDLITPNHNQVFEIGCGPGNITQYMLEKCPQLNIFATDLAPNMIELAKINNPSAQFAVLDSRNIDTIKQAFDVIICGFCLPYLSKLDITQLIKQSRRLLNQNGLIYLSTMEDTDEKSGLQTSSQGDQVYIHYHQFDFLQQTLTANNFEIINVQRKVTETAEQQVTTDLFIIAKAI